jgi:L-ornithine N5-oxygenase
MFTVVPQEGTCANKMLNCSVNEIFDPDRVGQFYVQSAPVRAALNSENRGTNYGVVRLELLEHIYETMYMQRILSPNEENWQHRILHSCNIVEVDSGDQNKLSLRIDQNAESKWHTFDAVIMATGYSRDSYAQFLAPVRHLMPGGDVPGKTWEVKRDYRVVFAAGAVDEDAGVYLQGCCEQTHGVRFLASTSSFGLVSQYQ